MWKIVSSILFGPGAALVKDLIKERREHQFRMAQSESEQEKAKLQHEIQVIDREIDSQRSIQDHYQKTHGPNWTRMPQFALECIAVFAAGAVTFRWLYGYLEVGDLEVIKWIVVPVLSAITGQRLASIWKSG